MSSACWRGYVATWGIVDQKLFLTAVNIGKRNALSVLFPGQESVLADWYSGTLLVPTGKLKTYVHMAYSSTYERYALLTVREGFLVREMRLSHSEFLAYRAKQFAAFRNTEEFKKQREDLRKSLSQHRVKLATEGETSGIATPTSMSDETLELFMFEFLAEEYLSMDFPEAK